MGSEPDQMTGPIDFAIQRAFWNGGEEARKHTRLQKHTSYHQHSPLLLKQTAAGYNRPNLDQ